MLEKEDHKKILEEFSSKFLISIEEMFGLNLEPISVSDEIQLKFNPNNQVLAMIDFSGTYTGFFALSANISTFSQSLKDILPEDLEENFNDHYKELNDILQELLNTIVGNIIDELHHYIPILTITAPRIIHFPKMYFPKVPVYKKMLKFNSGTFKFYLCIDAMQHEITSLFKASEQAAKAKNNFLATMSHEIRTPINAVIGMAELLQHTKLDHEQIDLTHTILKASDNLLTIVNDILDYSKIDLDNIEFENIDFNIHHLISQCIEQVSTELTKKGLDLLPLINYKVPTFMKGDPTRARQILLCFIKNAIKFTDKGEITVQITTKNLTEGFLTEFKITDTGIGIHKDNLKKIFDLFYQADDSMTRSYGGTGLGLATTKLLVNKLGGKISVKSEPGKGSEFTFVLSFLKSDRKSLPLVSSNQNYKILLYEDEVHTQKILQSYFETNQVLLITVDSLEDTINISNKHSFDMVLICIKEQGKEFTENIQQLKNELNKNEVPMVIITNRGKKGDAEQFRKLGFSAYFSKPIKPADLHECITLIKSKNDYTGNQIITTHTLAENKKSKPEILLVEDNPLNQKVFGKTLSKHHFNFEIANNGHEAIQAFENKKFDLILMDCQMPVMDGFESTRQIRAIEKNKNLTRTPIIACTANSFEKDQFNCAEAGMDGFLPKPVKSEQLLKIINSYIDKK